jgi:hypothetical protein
MDRQELLHGHCYWSVSVYANRPERLELWHVFYVEAAGKHMLIQDPVSGEAVSLRKWRSTEKKNVSNGRVSFNMSIDTDPQQQEAASPQVLVVRLFLR